MNSNLTLGQDLNDTQGVRRIVGELDEVRENSLQSSHLLGGNSCCSRAHIVLGNMPTYIFKYTFSTNI